MMKYVYTHNVPVGTVDRSPPARRRLLPHAAVAVTTKLSRFAAPFTSRGVVGRGRGGTRPPFFSTGGRAPPLLPLAK